MKHLDEMINVQKRMKYESFCMMRENMQVSKANI